MDNSEITRPSANENGHLVMIISNSPIYRDNLSTYLLDLQFSIAGPFENVDQSHTFLRKTQPDLILFDAMTSQSELISFSTMLKNETKNMPVLLLHNGESFTIGHEPMGFIFPPLDPHDLEIKINQLLELEKEGDDELLKFVNFMNITLKTIIRLTPEFGKVDINEILRNSLNTLKVRNSENLIIAKETIRITLTETENIDLENLVVNFKMVLTDVIEEIDKRLETDWGHSLIEDALEAVTIEMKRLPDPAIDVVEDLGKGYESIIKKFKRAVPDLHESEKNITISKLLLTDFGPELISVKGNDNQIKRIFDENIASQLLTLVGQGSSYHQGIFGPVPLPKTEDVIAIIWSKLINSNIKDQRMRGKTLVIVCLAFKKVIVNLIPPNRVLKDIFSDLEDLTHESEINDLILEKIAKNFRLNLQG